MLAWESLAVWGSDVGTGITGGQVLEMDPANRSGSGAALKGLGVSRKGRGSNDVGRGQ